MQLFSAPFEESLCLLAIESSCDDTACAVMNEQGKILSHHLKTQQEHAEIGGVVPELAARAHLEALPGLIEKTLSSAGLSLKEVTMIGATIGPGLIGGLLAGGSLAHGLSVSLNLPFYGVNHIEAHILSPLFSLDEDQKRDLLLKNPSCFPYLALLISGGHCQCVLVKGIGDYKMLGGTIDDSVGEAFDKVAKMLGLGWPGGPQIEKIARNGNPSAFSFPRPLKGREGCDFSFSGLKTAVSKVLEPYAQRPIPFSLAADIAASFQKAVTEILEDRLRHAILLAQREYPLKYLATGGGVACNSSIREMLQKLCAEYQIPCLLAPNLLCPDNAVMIAWAALLRKKWGATPSSLHDRPRPRWPLEEMRISSITQNAP